MNIRLKQVRISQNLTTKDFGSRLNLSASSITNLEKGRRKLTDRIIYDICREFSIQENWLRFGVGEMNNNSKLQTSPIQNIITNLNKLDSDTLSTLDKLISTMVKG